MSDESTVVGIDLGGTKMLATVVDRKGRILSRVKRPTRPARDGEELVLRLAGCAREAIGEAGVSPAAVAAVGVGAPAPIDADTGHMHHAPNLPLLSDFPLGRRLHELLDLPIAVDNDVNVGTLGEHVLGAGRGTRDMVGIFVGTGTGGGVILNGRLHRGFRGSAGEVGHMVVAYKGEAEEVLCGCGRPGCLEAYASRTAIEREIRAALAAGRQSLVPELLAKKKKDRITSGILAKALRRGDAVVAEVLESVQTHLALLVASVVNLLDPEAFVIGGGVAEALGEEFVRPIREQARRWYLRRSDAERVRILLSELGDDAGVLGAAMLAWQRVEDGRPS